MNLATLRALVMDLPEVQGWPELREFYEYGLSLPRGDWEWPLLACRAVGGEIERTAPVAAALTCMQLSITLVDDMLDHDPRGLHVRIGEGRTANVAFALQAAAYRLVHSSALEVAVRESVAFCLARMALGTAYGQHLDVQNLEGEENYWRTLHAKSGPFYGSGMEMGALAGGATAATAAELYEFGTLNGEIIQKMPTQEHGIIAGNIITWINMYLLDHPIGRAAVEATSKNSRGVCRLAAGR